MKMIRKIFREIDEGGNGVISKEELMTGLPKMSATFPDLTKDNFD